MLDTAGEARTNSSVMYSYGPLHMAKQKQDDQLEHTYSSSVRIRDVALKTCQKRWMIGRSDERGSGISVLAERHDDDDDDILRNHRKRVQVNVLRFTFLMIEFVLKERILKYPKKYIFIPFLEWMSFFFVFFKNVFPVFLITTYFWL